MSVPLTASVPPSPGVRDLPSHGDRRKSAPPTAAEAFPRELFELWDTLADFPAAQTDAALTYLLQALRRLMQADDVRWCLSVRLGSAESAEHDLCAGWRVREIVLADPNPEHVARVRRFLNETEKQNADHIGETTARVLRESGRFRIFTLHGADFVDFEKFRRSEHYRLYYEPLRLTDRMWVGCPVNSDVESGFVFDRTGRPENTRFGEKDRACAEAILRGMKWFHRRVVLSHGVTAGQTPCTPGERRALGLLLTGQSEKEIAAALEISAGTAHNRISAIFRKFGVRSRAELMALWL